MRFRNPSAATAFSWTWVSSSCTRIAPMSAFEMPPDLHSIGSSQRASALRVRPTDRLTHWLLVKSSLGPLSRGPLSRRSPRSFFSHGFSRGGASEMSSGADLRPRCKRTKAAATWSAPCSAISAWAVSWSASDGISCKDGSLSRRSLSLAITSSALGGLAHTAFTLAEDKSRSTRLRALNGTISVLTPFLPARPVRPDRCSSPSLFFGKSAWTTKSSPGRSIPRAATSVATQTCARPSRIAWRAWVRSFWLSSPDRATTEKPRLFSRAVRWFTFARVPQKMMALGAS